MRCACFAGPGRRSTRRRYGAVALLLFALAGQLSSLWHLAVTRHAVCLEHGELIHTAEDGAGARAPAGTERRLAALQARDADGAEHGHDHCAVAAHRRSSVLFRVAASVGLAPPTTGHDAATHTAAARTSGREIFRFAPKASPPRELTV